MSIRIHKSIDLKLRDWNYSSYHGLVSNIPTHLQRDRIMELFGSREDFIRIHQEIQPLQGFEDEE